MVNGLAVHSRILTGYIPGAEALKVVAGHIANMVKDDPEILYVLDRERPRGLSLFAAVMGDIGKGLYVSSDVVPIYKDMLKMATVITPNQFEAE